MLIFREVKLKLKPYLSESSAVEIDNLYLQLSEPGRNWNQAELAALKRRQAKLYRREIRDIHRNHLKRNTQRYTEVSSIGGSDIDLSETKFRAQAPYLSTIKGIDNAIDNLKRTGLPCKS